MPRYGQDLRQWADYFVMNSDPRKKDTDEDGILDHDDPLKLTYGISNCMSNDYKEELFSEIDQIIKDDFSWIMENKNIGYYSTRDCIDILYEYDDLITDLSNGYLLPKAAIQTMFALFGTFSITWIVLYNWQLAGGG